MRKGYYYDEESKLLFMYDEDSKYYFPFMYEYNSSTQQGKLFLENPLFKQLYNYVEFVRRRPDKRTGKMRSVPLFIYQWIGLYIMIQATLERNSKKFLMAWSRQGGKSEVIKLFCGFAPIFIPEFTDIALERFYLVVGSYKEEAVKKLSSEIKPYIYKAIEYYNDTNEHKLVIKKDEPKLTDEIFTMEINKLFFGSEKSIPYSYYKAITCGTTQDGLSAHALVVDEAGLISSDLFETSVSPFLTTTGGCQFIFGVPNHNGESVFVQKYISTEVNKIIYTWEDIVKMRYLTDVEMALFYRNKVLGDIKEKGENSPFIQWNYYLNPNVASGKFITEDNLKSLNIMTEDIMPSQLIQSTRGNNKTFIVAGFDTSIKHDYKSLVIGKTEVDDDIYYNTVYDMITFNKNRKDRMTVEKVAETVIQKCIEYKVDVLCFDTTTIGLVLAQNLIKYMSLYKVVISLCPYYYTTISKSNMFNYLESCLYDNRLRLLNKSASWEAEKLYEEMITMDKSISKTNNSIINYSAPKGEDFSDDHMNALALFNIGLKELISKIKSTDKKKRMYDDGANRFNLYLSKFKLIDEDNILDRKKKTVKIKQNGNISDSWCSVL